jgi:RNA polymerase sigma-70 factor (ECF subfamily)
VVGETEFVSWLTVAQPVLRRRARRLTHEWARASDLVQATNLRALEKRSLFTTGAAQDFLRWLLRIMINLHRDEVRAGRRELVVDWLEDVPGSVEVEPPLWLTLDDRDVIAAIERLGPKLRTTYELYAVERCSYATISSRLGIPINTVATQVFRARQCLRRDLGGRPFETAHRRPAVGSQSCPRMAA